MMYQWTPDMIRFMNDASKKTDYFKDLASLIFKEIGAASNVCDAGCGLGQLANELQTYYPCVTGIDINHDAIEFFNKNKNKEVKVIEADLNAYNPKVKFDLMVFNYFGDIKQIINIHKNCCCGKSVVIKRNYKSHRFSFERKPINSYNRETAVDYLIKNNISYKELSFVHEFGQPFKNLDDAVLFFNTYSRDEDRSIITKENVARRLTKTDDSTFPFYMQHTKESSILII